MLDVDVVGAGAHEGGGVEVLPGFGLHAAEGHVGLGYFVFALDFEVVGAWVGEELPGPTTGLIFAVGCGFSPLNTNAINFINIDVI